MVPAAGVGQSLTSASGQVTWALRVMRGWFKGLPEMTKPDPKIAAPDGPFDNTQMIMINANRTCGVENCCVPAGFAKVRLDHAEIA